MDRWEETKLLWCIGLGNVLNRSQFFGTLISPAVRNQISTTFQGIFLGRPNPEDLMLLNLP